MVAKRKNRFPKSKKLTMSQQYYQLKMDYPESIGSFRGNEYLSWQGWVQPTPCSPVYKIQVAYKYKGYPKVKVLSPSLEKKDKKQLPHVYSKDELCLFYPGFGEWSSSMSIAKTIVPWASEWLFYYEIWLSTGEWRGGGIHPGKPKEESKISS